jgi:hypothetical protein
MEGRNYRVTWTVNSPGQLTQSITRMPLKPLLVKQRWTIHKNHHVVLTVKLLLSHCVPNQANPLSLFFSGVGAHHENEASKHAIQTIATMFHTMLLHCHLLWQDTFSPSLWLMAVDHVQPGSRIIPQSSQAKFVRTLYWICWTKRLFACFHVFTKKAEFTYTPGPVRCLPTSAWMRTNWLT